MASSRSMVFSVVVAAVVVKDVSFESNPARSKFEGSLFVLLFSLHSQSTGTGTRSRVSFCGSTCTSAASPDRRSPCASAISIDFPFSDNNWLVNRHTMKCAFSAALRCTLHSNAVDYSCYTLGQEVSIGTPSLQCNSIQ